MYTDCVAQVETYHYDSYGQLQSVAIAVQDLVPITDPWGTNSPQVGALGAAVTRAVYTNDAMGRTIAQSDYLEDGTTIAYSRAVTYNGKSQVTDETTATRQGTDTWTSVVHNEYGSGTAYALGAATVVTTSDSKNGTYQYATTTTHGFVWWDGAVQSNVSVARTGQSTSNSTYSYGGSGQLASISVVDNVRNRTIAFTTDMLGQVIRRDEADNIAYNASWQTGGDPHEVWYRFNGRQIAYTGNNGTHDTDYAASIAARTKVPVTGANAGAFRHGLHNGPNFADYDPSLERINSYSQGGAGGGYTVRAGDTLAGIALNLWGNAALWYKLAEANGLGAASGLVEGRNLIVPRGVQNNQHNAATLKPYDPAETIGDTSPAAPQPQKKGGKCGTFGIIMLAVIAVAVTIVTAGAAVAALAPASAGIGSIGAGIAATLGVGGITGAAAGVSAGTLIAAGAIGGAVGSAVSQGIGVLTGIQEKFNWKGVALGAIGGAVGGATGVGGLFGKAGAFAGVGNAFAQGALRGVLSSGLIQGIGVAVGLQKKFDWTGLAAAGVGGGITAGIGNALGMDGSHLTLGLVGKSLVSGMAGNIANAATRSLIDGTDFGDNIIAALPDVIASTIGGMIGAAAAESYQARGAARGIRDAVAGDAPRTAEQRAAERAVAQAIRASSDHPRDRANQARLEATIRHLIEVSATTPEARARVEDYRASVFGGGSTGSLGSDGDGPVLSTVTGSFSNVDYWAGRSIDKSGIWIGEQQAEIAGKVTEFLDAHPGAAIALNVANVGLTVYGGPVRALAGYAYESGKERIRGWVAGGYQDVGWESADAANGGSGITLAGSIILSGLGAIAAFATAKRWGGGGEGIPHGFPSPQAFRAFGRTIHQGLNRAGYPDSVVRIRGSSVTGESHTRGVPFDAASDFDLAIASETLLARAREAGIPTRSSGARTGPLGPQALDALGLSDLAATLSRQAGRNVSFMIYRSVDAITGRGPSMPVPRGR